MALSKYDQSVYDAGYRYIPQSQYLLNPFQVPKGSENEVPTGIATTYQAQNMMGGGGGGFNPYNADMSQIRTDYNPRYDFRLFQDFGVTSPDQLTTEQAKEMALTIRLSGVSAERARLHYADFGVIEPHLFGSWNSRFLPPLLVVQVDLERAIVE